MTERETEEEERNERDKGRVGRGERVGGRREGGILFWAGVGITHGFPPEWVDNIRRHNNKHKHSVHNTDFSNINS